MAIKLKIAVKAMRTELVAQANFDKLCEDEERLKALASTLADEAQSEQHGSLMMREWARISQFVPTPADIVEMAGRVGDPSAPEIPAGCERCGGELWVAVTRGETSGVERCNCARGQYLRSRDKERTAAPAPVTRERGGLTKARVIA